MTMMAGRNEYKPCIKQVEHIMEEGVSRAGTNRIKIYQREAAVLGSASKFRRVTLAGAGRAYATGIYVCRCGHRLGIAT